MNPPQVHNIGLRRTELRFAPQQKMLKPANNDHLQAYHGCEGQDGKTEENSTTDCLMPNTSIRLLCLDLLIAKKTSDIMGSKSSPYCHANVGWKSSRLKQTDDDMQKLQNMGKGPSPHFPARLPCSPNEQPPTPSPLLLLSHYSSYLSKVLLGQRTLTIVTSPVDVDAAAIMARELGQREAGWVRCGGKRPC